MDNIQFAPVMIPTLNRYDHFTQCIESLEKCTGADKTDVYVALDYPPSEMYVEGWKKIDEYLKAKEKSNAFSKLIVFRREKNCGVGKPDSNSELLGTYVRERYDRYIFSEDDNIFSPNFLEYINKGLDKYKEDPNVIAICGYSHPYNFKKTDGRNHFFHNTDYSAWGTGCWSDKVTSTNSFLGSGDMKSYLNFRTIQRAYKHGYNRVLNVITVCHIEKGRYFWITDSVLSAFMITTGSYVVMPTVSKVRNIGWDELGTSSRLRRMDVATKELANRHNSQEIDNATSFDYNGDPMLYFDENNWIAAMESDGRISLFEFIKRLLFCYIKISIKFIYRVLFR